MKRRRAVQLVALGGLTLPLAGCTDEASQADENSTETDDADDTVDEDDADGDADADDEEEPDEDDDSADEPDEQEFSGSGDDAIEDVSIEGGLTVVDATYEGDSEGEGEGDFEVRLIPEERLAEDDEADDANADEADAEEGEESAEDGADDAEEAADEEDDPESALFVRSSFVDSADEYEGQTAHPVDEGTYVLSVVADGDWEVTVLQPRAESGDEPPISVSGDGNEVHGPFEFDGSYQPSGDYDGERIVADIYSPTGDTTEFVFHEDSIENPTEIEFDGVGYLAVKSDGEWSVDIE